ncbi:MAG TPA: aldehyde dehydrogenase family protein [Candidatus Dormibacteraeota bacterium]|nr:aldehyde dehydrogenase family protein [Candidatus Dormibacteraeota bacterium]
MVAQTKVAAKSWGIFVNGTWLNEGETSEIRSPYDHSVVGEVHLGTASHAEAAVRAAQRAFETTKKSPGYERKRILNAISEGIRARHEEFSQVMCLEAGKPIKTARVEVDRAIFTFAVAAEEATRIGGEWLPLDWQSSTAGRAGIVRRFPVGPILAITPFNFPLNLVAHKVAPAIAAGCTIILKPAPQTPFSSLLLAEVVASAGLTAGAFNVLPLANDVAEKLVSDDRLKMLTFTGSAKVGWALKQKAGKKKVTLELGGNAGVIVHSDADVAYAADRCVAGGFSYSGQTCISVQRIYVQRAVYDNFLSRFVAGVKKLRMGNPVDDSTDVGPLINEGAARRTEEWIGEAAASGAKIETGGKREGSMVVPTVLTHTRPDMKVSCEEVFAPVVLVEPYDNFADAIRHVNDSPNGLQAGVFTRDVKLLFTAFDELEVGGVISGDTSSFRIDHMPYGGVKDSGLGREGLRYAIEEMTEPRLLVLNLQ